ncbi:MAG: dihydrofolate synthase / folylpolyglutamate synthase [Acidimicrobiaceae bacterium]|jgi:dihydrofolate synthase/folylpolyglutamate synthase|nr:dihydrofolate synthase / folylpolyglutamate synthase [Acidimicrobiaceae bacterium]
METMEQAQAWLDDHINLEAILTGRREAPTLDRMAQLTGLMGDPQHAYPVIHLTGTNGKGSAARMATGLLVAQGLSVGTYTSPHLERINERVAWNLDPIPDPALVEVLSALADLEALMADKPTLFEVLAAAAFRWFADIAVDAGVIEVGMGGRWDATNVADGQVAAVTNVSLDHAEILGPRLEDIATEKSGIVKPGSTLVLGETAPDLASIFRSAGAAEVWERNVDFACEVNDLAVGGRVLDLRTPGARYEDVFLPLHGAHQGDNAAVALAAAEAFFGAPLDEEVVREAFGTVRNPGRMEITGRQPLTILDGAHNPAGAAAAAATLASEFEAVASRILVVGMLRGRDPTEMLEALDVRRARLVIACPPPSPRALPAEEVAAAAEALGVPAETAPTAAAAVGRALWVAKPEDLVFVVGSLYLAGAARSALLAHRPSPSP